MEIKLRPYQLEAIERINAVKSGRKVVVSATGTGKTVIMSNIKRNGRMLILSHRDELVYQPLKYFTCSTGVEKASSVSNHTEEVVSASIQTISRRLKEYDPHEFSIICQDEAHHAAAPSYRLVLDYFKPEKTIGFTATPSRNDGSRLDNIFDEIIFEYNILDGMRDGYLCPVKVCQVKLDYDLSEVKIQRGDFASTGLAEAMKNTAPAIAEVYEKYAKGTTIIFAPSVKIAYEISDIIPGSKVIEGNTPKDERRQILEDYKNGKIKCICNNMVLTEGFDNPRIETVLFCRPTMNKTLWQQAAGRGTRTFPGKEYCKIIDCVGTSRVGLVSAGSLVGYDQPEAAKRRIKDGEEIDLLEYEDYCESISDVPETWVKSYREIDIWAKQNKYNLHDMALRKRGNGELVIGLPNGVYYSVPPIDVIGNCTFKNGRTMKAQDAIDALFKHLMKNHSGEMAIWSKRRSNRWRKDPITEKQRRMVEHIKNVDLSGIQVRELTAGEASIIINEVNIRKNHK